MEIGRLTRVPLRDLWRNEAHNFTAWLATNLDLLGDALDMPMTLVQREATAGDFSVDIVAETPGGRNIIIENQLERTDHDHLGKLITYMSNLDAKTAIWITSKPRPEHETAVHWLNELLPADTSFYLVKLDAMRIGDSPAAPFFSVIAGPSQEARDVGDEKKKLAERHLLRQEFWKGLLEISRQRTALHSRIAPGTENWISASAGMGGLGFNYVVRMSDAQVELYIDRGTKVDSERIFDALYQNRQAIEMAFGASLDWQRLDDRRACRVRYVFAGNGLLDRGGWPELQRNLVDAMIRLERTFRPEIQQLRG